LVFHCIVLFGSDIDVGADVDATLVVHQDVMQFFY